MFRFKRKRKSKLPQIGETQQMTKNLTVITLGMILDEIRKEGLQKGKNWKVDRLFVTRNEKRPGNVPAKLVQLQRMNKHATEKDALNALRFSYFREEPAEYWRIYSREEAEILKKEIKEAKGWTE